MDSTHGYPGATGNLADRLALAASGHDRGLLVGVDDLGAATDLASLPCGVETVLRLGGDVPATVFCQGEGQVKDQGPFRVFSGGDAVEHLDLDALLEQIGQDDETFEQVAAKSVDLLDGEHVVRTEVVEGGLESGAVVDRQLAADLLLEHLDADRVEGVMLTSDVLTLRADADETYECL